MRSPIVFLLLMLSSVLPAGAGQVRIDVGMNGELSFTPSNASLNQGDQVIWIWNSGSHTVTQGSSCIVPGSPIFDTGTNALTNSRFSWRADRTGTINYFCRPHCSMGMTGTLTIAASGVPVADFRITEIRRTNEHTDDYVEISNLGAGPGNLGAYRLTTQGNNPTVLPLTDIPVPAGGQVIVHMGVSGTNTPTDLYMVAGNLIALGAIALIIPNQVVSFFNDGRQMIDYVRWGSGTAGDALLFEVAGNAEIWPPGQFLPQIPQTGALEFCGNATDHGPSFWAVVTNPSPHVDDNCASPARLSTWGTVKNRY